LLPLDLVPPAFIAPPTSLAVSAGSAAALVPACLLVNGATITRDDQALTVTYFHVELGSRDILLAEGLACESYRDTGNRDRFAEGRGACQGFMPSCLPLVSGGARLASARTDLHRRAEAMSYQIDHRLPIEALAGDSIIAGRLRRGWVHFAPPTRVDYLRLRLPACMPASTDPASEDRRVLEFCEGLKAVP
jgi:hypothetical protein